MWELPVELKAPRSQGLWYVRYECSQVGVVVVVVLPAIPLPLPQLRALTAPIEQ